MKTAYRILFAIFFILVGMLIGPYIDKLIF